MSNEYRRIAASSALQFRIARVFVCTTGDGDWAQPCARQVRAGADRPIDRIAGFVRRPLEGHERSARRICRTGSASNRPNRPWVARDDLVRGQQRDAFNPGLGYQDAIEGVLVNGWEQVDGRRMGAGHFQLDVAVLQQASTEQPWFDIEVSAPKPALGDLQS